MHPHNDSGPKPGAIDRFAVRVLRLEQEEEFLVRVLSTSYSGLMGHYVAKRTEYCSGPQRCPRSLHQRPTLWKGYFAGELWCPRRKLWFPTVVELTEGAELDVRGRFARGQTWRLWKPKKVDDKNPPLCCDLHEQCDPASVSRPFDVLPVIASLYHVASVQLGIDNPMPPKTIVAPIAGAAPSGKDGGGEKPLASQAEIKDMMEKVARTFRMNGGGK